jgi:Uma2 family endonuclease
MPEPDVTLEYFDRPGAYERRPLPREIGLIIEVADSSLAYDLGSKRARYARAGIVEYWVADLVNKRMHVFSDPDRKAGKYRSARRIDVARQGPRRTLAPAAFPDARIELRRIFYPGPIDA